MGALIEGEAAVPCQCGRRAGLTGRFCRGLSRCQHRGPQCDVFETARLPVSLSLVQFISGHSSPQGWWPCFQSRLLGHIFLAHAEVRSSRAGGLGHCGHRPSCQSAFNPDFRFGPEVGGQKRKKCIQLSPCCDKSL